MKKYNIKTTDVELLKKWYYLMTLGRALDEKAPAYLLQSLGWSFHAPYAGHDGIQLAIGQVFTKGEDFLFPYYRDMLTALSAGMTAEELILNGISKATDPGSGGRHMSNHFAKPEWHIENISSATGTHDLHAAGVHVQWYIMTIKESLLLHTANLLHPKALSTKLSMVPALNACPLFLYGRIMDMVYLFRRKTRRQPVKWRITSPDSKI